MATTEEIRSQLAEIVHEVVNVPVEDGQMESAPEEMAPRDIRAVRPEPRLPERGARAEQGLVLRLESLHGLRERLPVDRGRAQRHVEVMRLPAIADGQTARHRRRSCRARTEPSTTGSTISKCEGFAVSDRCT